MSKYYFHFADLMTVNVFSLDFREIQRKVFTATAQAVKAFSPSSKSCHVFSLAVKPALKLQVWHFQATEWIEKIDSVWLISSSEAAQWAFILFIIIISLFTFICWRYYLLLLTVAFPQWLQMLLWEIVTTRTRLK